MSDLSTVTIVGRLAADPELRFTPSGKPVANMVVMTSRSQKTEAGTWENTDVTGWPVTAWGTLAENIAESCTKGSPVIVIGRGVQRSWETKEGEKRSKMEVQADHVGFSLHRHTVRANAVSGAGNAASAASNDPWADSDPNSAPF